MTNHFSHTPVLTKMTVIPVAGTDSMLLNLSGAHAPFLTRNVVKIGGFQKMKIGFIGLGIMGKPMSKNVVKAGYEIVVLEKNKGASELVAIGAKTASTPKALAEQVDMIITMLPNSPQVREVILGADES